MWTFEELFVNLQDGREVLPPASEATTGAVAAAASASASAAPHGIEIASEFKPVERPSEPLDNDQPIQCPLPEPSILNVSFNFNNVMIDGFLIRIDCFLCVLLGWITN